MLHWADHIASLLLCFVWPAWSIVQGKRGVQWLARHPEERTASYRTTMLLQWGVTLGLVALWFALGRPWKALGLGLEGTLGFWITLALLPILAFLLRRQWCRVHDDPATRARVREQLVELEGLVPSTPAEVRTFRALAVTAGICEEVTYRGYLLWYLGVWLPPIASELVMMLAFAAGHLYQGIRGAAHVAVLAGIAALLYRVTGSLWIPMFVHAAFDLYQVALARSVGSSAER